MGKTQQSRAFIFDRNPTSLSTGSYSVAESDQLLKCDTGAGTIDINLLAIGEKWDYEYKLYVIDSGGSSSSNNITIYAPIGHLINGQSSITINVDNGSVLIRIADSTNYIAHLSSTSNYQGIINTTYSVFSGLASGGTLIPGAWYRISDYQTVHYILEDPSYPIHTGSVEPIYVFATSPSTYDERVVSENYPEDLLYWRIDVKSIPDDAFYAFLDFVPGYKGRITYRKDTINNIEAYYDWREFVFRRWSIDTGAYATWDSTTTYLAGTIVLDPTDNCYYAAILDAPPSINPPIDQGYFVKIVDAANLYVFAQPNTHYLSTGILALSISISVSVDSYQDFSTVGNFTVAKNISLEQRGGLGDVYGELPYPVETFAFTGYPIANTAIPNIVLITDVALSSYPYACTTINGFYAKANSSMSTFYFQFDGTTQNNSKNIEIRATQGIYLSLAFSKGGKQPLVSSLRIEDSKSNIIISDLIIGFSLRWAMTSVFNGKIFTSDFNYINDSTYRSGPSYIGYMSIYSNFNKIYSSNYFCEIDTSRFNSIGYSNFGYFYLGKKIKGAEISSCYTEDYSASTYIYDNTYDIKIMGTTGGSWLLYIDGTGTLQTDVATN